MLPFRLEPYMKKVLWGGTFLSYFKGVDASLDHVGESWEVSALPGCESVVASGPFAGTSLGELCRTHGPELMGRQIYSRFGEQFPLLVKFLDAADNLSVQVHPDDTLAMKRHGMRGKNEMWYILGTLPGAKLRLGFNRKIDHKEYDRRVADGSIIEVLTEYKSHPGDVFYIPAGQVHALGAGNFLVEIQQAADITYRLHDYDRRDANGNPRQLHCEQAREAVVFEPSELAFAHPEGSRLISVDCFTVDRLDIGPDSPFAARYDSFAIIVCVDGAVAINAQDSTLAISRGHTAIIPADLQFEIAGRGKALLIVP